MKNFKSLFEEEDIKAILKAQNERKESENKLHSRLEKHYAKINGSGLKDYTAYSGNINSYLWNRHKGIESENPELEGKINRLDHTLGAMKTPEAMTVWSKSIHDPRALKDDTDTMVHPAYLSTSIFKNVPTQQYSTRNVVKDKKGITHHHIFKINIPKNSSGVFISDAHNVDNKAKEFLLPKGSRLRYKNTETKKDYEGESDETHYHTHHMELIS